jgi:hypothetical protein
MTSVKQREYIIFTVTLCEPLMPSESSSFIVDPSLVFHDEGKRQTIVRKISSRGEVVINK